MGNRFQCKRVKMKKSLEAQLTKDQTIQLKTAVYHQRTQRKSNQEIVHSNRNQESARRWSRKKRDLTLLLQIKTWV